MLLTFVAITLLAPSNTWYVDAGAASPGLGSLAQPYSRIDYAVAQASTQSGDLVLVAPGDYVDENIDYGGKSLLVESSGGALMTTISGLGSGAANPHALVSMINGEDESAILRGFTLRNGSGRAGGRGGALHCSGSSPSIEQCRFENNLGGNTGSAAYIDGGAPSFVNCWFGGNGGDGPLLANSSNLKLSGCFFSDSLAAPRGNVRLLGGSLVATDCYFDGNASGSGDGKAAMHLMAVQSQLDLERCHWRSGGGVNVSGRALYLEGCVTFIDNSTFTDFHPLDLPGGAMLAADGDLSMTAVQFTGCVTEQGVGGAVALVGCRAVLSSCEFQSNSSAPSEASGGAIYKWGPENLVVKNCLFEGNRAGEGGALHVAFGPAAVLGSFFLDNVAMVEDHLTVPARGGALVSFGPLLVDQCAFVGNQARADSPGALGREALGGAMYLGGPSTLSGGLFHENVASGQTLAFGGAIYAEAGAAGSTLTHMQLRRNSCSTGMGGTARGGGLAGDLNSSNCSFLGNQAANGGGSAWGGVLDHCIVEGGSAMELGGSSLATYSLVSGGYSGIGNISGDPLFWGTDDLHLLPGSPCIDSGDPNRPADLDGTPADMGALAFDPQHCGPGCLGVISSRPCSSVPNSSGFEAHTIALGSNGVQDNMVILFSEQLPIGVPGYYLAAPQGGFVPLFGGSEGTLCLGQGIVRMNAAILQVNAAGQVSRTLDLTQMPQGQTVMPGSSWHYQLWFRDFNGVQSTSNTTSSARVDFQ